LTERADGSAELLRERFGEVGLLELGRNLGFGPALNRAIAERPGDPAILLNDDVDCEPRFVEAMLAAAEGAEMVAGVLLQEAAPGLIDSAGVVADRTLMGFDYLHGEPAEAAEAAPAPLGPTGGAALYRLDAFRAAGGFDERIFLYYEDLDLALRLGAAGARCRNESRNGTSASRAGRREICVRVGPCIDATARFVADTCGRRRLPCCPHRPRRRLVSPGSIAHRHTQKSLGRSIQAGKDHGRWTSVRPSRRRHQSGHILDCHERCPPAATRFLHRRR